MAISAGRGGSPALFAISFGSMMLRTSQITRYSAVRAMPLGEVALQTAQHCPRQQHRSRAEHRQGVDEGDDHRQQQSVGLADQQQARQQLEEGNDDQHALCPEPPADGDPQAGLDGGGGLPPLGDSCRRRKAISWG